LARVAKRRERQDIQLRKAESGIKVYQAAIYARLSREDNLSNSDSIENQIALLERYIDARPYLQLADIFADNGFTGTDFERPEWQRLMEAVQQRKINCIIVKDLSRLGRNYIETGEFLEKICPFFGIRFIAVNDNFDTDTAEANGQLSVSLSNIINDYYAKDISRKVTSALRSKMEKGEYIGSWEKYGYVKSPENKNQLIVNPETAPVVRMIYQWRSEGMSYMGINKKLNDMGIPSPGQYKADRGIVTNNNQKPRKILWNKHMVTDILKDITYLGHLAQRKTTQCLYAGIPFSRTEEQDWIQVENTHEAIIEPELFEKVQEINKKAAAAQKANRGKYDHLPKAKNIYGKKFTCADCGSVMKLVRSISTNKDKVYFTFKCPTHEEHGARACTAKRMRKADVDEAVLSSIKAQFELFLDCREALDSLLKAKKKQVKKAGKSDQAKELKKQLEKKKSVFSGLYRDLREGLIDDQDYAQTREILMEDISRLEKQLAELKSAKAEYEEPLQEAKIWETLIEKYAHAEEISEELADAMIESMQMNGDNSLSIQFKYMDSFQAVLDTVKILRKEVA
jgi:putative tnpX site-specific recombinase